MGTPSSPESNLAAADSSHSMSRWLLGFSTGALLLIQVLLWARVSFDELRFGALCAIAFVVMLWSRRETLRLASGPLPTMAGLALVGIFLIRGSGQSGSLFATLAPLLWGTGMALLASGFAGIAQYWREAIVLIAVAVTPLVETFSLDVCGLDLTPVTAHLTAYLLRISGWNAYAHDFMINLPATSVVVAQGCSGLKTMYFLVGFAVIILLLYPLPGGLRKAAVLVGAAVIGFAVNAVRVALLAVVAGEPGAFRFWHIQQGAMFFELLAIGLFLAFFYYVFPERPAPPPVPRYPVK